jgi:apolipoprotein N-acyltransferase
MGSANRLIRATSALSVFIAAAVLLYFGDGLTPRWPLMWFAPLLVLLFALYRPAWQAGLLAFAAWLAGCLSLWHYLRVLGGPPVAWFAYCGSAALVFAVCVLLFRALAHKASLWSAWLALPAAWITFEFTRNLLWSHGSGACVAYSQLNFLPFLQTASLAGPWGMGFVLMLFPAGLALSIYRWRTERKQAVLILGATFSVLAALLTFGVVRLATPQGGPAVKVALVVSDANGDVSVDDPRARTQRLFENYADHARQLIAKGAQVVVMPEGMGAVLDSTVAQVDAVFQPVADETGAVLVVGTGRIGAAGRHNEARIYAPQAPVRSYDKEHLLEPWETSHFTPGTSRTLFPAPGRAAGQTWAVAICMDLDFTNPARADGQAGAALMLTPASDFRVDRFYHGHIAVMRAVEDGFSLVRAARHGFLTVADNRGRIVAEIGSGAAPFATLLATVPAGRSATPFLYLGDWFGWCAIALLALVLRQLARGSQARLHDHGRSLAPRPAPRPESIATAPAARSTLSSSE